MKELCPVCLQPKVEKSKGSLTQWIAACQCDKIEREEELFDTLKICQTCWKRVSLTRHGSFTQWVFRSDLCKCDKPAIKVTDQSATGMGTFEVTSVEYPEMDTTGTDYPEDRFKPVEELGRGAGSVVYRSQDRRLKNIVAIKVVNRLEPGLIVSFQEEARIISKLNHENIVKVLDISTTENGTPFMVLEYIPGLSLSRFLKNHGKIETKKAISLAIELCSALAHAHNNGVVHRDLQPSNVLLTKGEDGTLKAKLIDFGLASIEQALSQNIKYQGRTLAGTPPYMSPDQAAGHSFDERSDLYSLGCLLFETLTGSPPFRGESAVEILNKQLEERTPKLTDYLEESALVVQLQSIINQCIAKSMDDRYRSADLLARDLRECLPLLGSSDIKAPQRDESDEEQPADSLFRINFAAAMMLLVFVGAVASFLISNGKKNSSIVKTDIINPSLVNFDKPDSLMELVDPLSDFIVLKGTLLNDSDLKGLRLYRNAIIVDLSTTFITDSGTSYLKSPELLTLALRNTQVKTLEHVARLKSLRTLYLSGNRQINEEALTRLTSLPNLEVLDLRNTGISNESLAVLTDCPNLRVLSADSEQIDDGAVQFIARLQNLNRLFLTNTHLSRKGMKRLVELMPHCSINFSRPPEPRFKIAERSIILNERPAGTSFKQLAKYKYATYINLSDNEISDEDTKYIASDYLQRLDLNRTGVKTLDYVSRISSLKNLHLAGSAINNQSIKKLKKLTNLRKLDLQNTRINDAAIPDLCKLTSLHQLEIENSLISNAGKQKLFHALPACRIDRLWKVPWFGDNVKTLWKKARSADLYDFFSKAIKTIEETQGNDAPLALSLKNNIAWILAFFDKKPAQAESLVNENLSRARSLNSGYNIRMSLRIKLLIVKRFRDVEKLTRVRQAVLKYIENNPGESEQFLREFFNYGNWRFGCNKPIEAIDAYDEVLFLMDKLKYYKLASFTNVPVMEIITNAWLGECLATVRDYRRAEAHLKRADNIMTRNWIKDIRLQSYVKKWADSCRLLAEIFAKQGNHRDAILYQQKCMSIIVENRLKGLAEQKQKLKVYKSSLHSKRNPSK